MHERSPDWVVIHFTKTGVSFDDAAPYLGKGNMEAAELLYRRYDKKVALAVLMEAGLAKFGDQDWLVSALQEIGRGTAQGKLWAQGAARVGEHYGVRHVPVSKKQAISAYDPRVSRLPASP